MNIFDTIGTWFDDLRGKREYRRYREKEQRKSRVVGQLLSLLNIICALYYLVWCLLHASWQYWYIFIPFILTEVAFFLLYLLWINLLWYKRHHRPEGINAKTPFSVDVFIPVCREPLAIVRETVTAACAIDYPHKKVHILDDGEDDAVKRLAEELNIGYFRRPTHENSKAGNLNYAYRHTTEELILAIDADQVADPNFISSIVGYFELPRIGLVQTAQRFKLPKGDPWGNSDEVFYRAMQSGKDHDNAAISCGNGAMYRRRALEEIGGFSEWNLVEDLHTSMKLHDRGWKSVYHDTPFTTGTAPAESLSQLKQRWQWAVDSLRILFWDNPLFRQGLSGQQKLQYLHFGYNYIAFGIFLPIFFLIPIWALLTHQFMLTASVLAYALARLPYALAYILTNKLMTDRTHKFKAFQAQASLFAAYFSAVFAALRARTTIPPYTVTPKVTFLGSFPDRLYRCLPHLAIILLSLFAMYRGLTTIHDDFWFLVINILWCSWTIVLLWRFVALSLFHRWLVKWH